MHDLQTVLEFTIAPGEGLNSELARVVHGPTGADMDPAPPVTFEDVVVNGTRSAIDSISPIQAAWGPLLDKVKWFSDIVDVISEVRFRIGCLPCHLLGCLILGSSLCENGVVHPGYCT
jgi:hypothetical protein